MKQLQGYNVDPWAGMRLGYQQKMMRSKRVLNRKKARREILPISNDSLNKRVVRTTGQKRNTTDPDYYKWDAMDIFTNVQSKFRLRSVNIHQLVPIVSHWPCKRRSGQWGVRTVRNARRTTQRSVNGCCVLPSTHKNYLMALIRLNGQKK